MPVFLKFRRIAPFLFLVSAIFYVLFSKNSMIIAAVLSLLIGQVIFWIFLVLSLHQAERRQELDFDLIKKSLTEKGLKTKISKRMVFQMFFSFLLISTLFEALRGLWLFWALTAGWISLMFAFFWKFWRYAFED